VVILDLELYITGSCILPTTFAFTVFLFYSLMKRRLVIAFTERGIKKECDAAEVARR